MSHTLLILTGPTASGKTDVSIRLAGQWNTEIISCDSRQMFRELTIGTAKPDQTQLAQIPHHLINNLSIYDSYSAFKFEQDALRILKDLFTRHDLVIMTGGTGLYLDAILNGIDDIPDPDPDIRNNLQLRCTAEGLDNLLIELEQLDPVYFHEVDKSNPARVLRGLEVCLTTGQPFSSFRLKQAVNRDFNILLASLEVPRPILYERIDLRVDRMMRDGLAEEARAFYPVRNLNSLNTVGYRELFGMFDGLYDLDEAVRLIKRNTRHYAKRQITWNNRYPMIKRFSPDDTDEMVNWVTSEMSGLGKTHQ